eukprot:2723353-Pleurochrysis_carterae.AAC.1
MSAMKAGARIDLLQDDHRRLDVHVAGRPPDHSRDSDGWPVGGLSRPRLARADAARQSCQWSLAEDHALVDHH